VGFCPSPAGLHGLQAQITKRDAVIIHDPPPTVSGDATRLSQVLQNLIGHALSFAKQSRRASISPTIEETITGGLPCGITASVLTRGGSTSSSMSFSARG